MFQRKTTLLSLMLLGLSSVVVLPAAAVDEVAEAGEVVAAVEATAAKLERDWSVDFTPYLWVVNMNMTLKGGPIDNTYGIDTVELLKNLSGYAMVDMNVRYKRVGIIADGMWARVSTSQSLPSPIGSISHELDLQIDMAFGTGAAFYQFRPTKQLTLAPYIGARWWRINSQLDLVDNGGPLPDESGNVITKWADPIFGLKADYEINDKWFSKLSGDVGGGVSRVSWQAILGGGYRFTDWFALDVVYRIMGVNYQPGGDKIKMKFNGVLFGFNFHY